jgi:hypothetical protein
LAAAVWHTEQVPGDHFSIMRGGVEATAAAVRRWLPALPSHRPAGSTSSPGTHLSLGRLTGAWHLARITVATGGRTVEAGRPDVTGLLAYTGDGHFAVTIQLPDGLLGFDFAAYCGTVAIERGRVVHQVLAGAEPTPAGSTQVREAILTSGPDPTLTLSGSVDGAALTLTWLRGCDCPATR